MFEDMMTSKVRVDILKLFLANMDNKYYLRELERVLNESLSPLRRQLLKLEKMGILISEEEANLKYYRLNKNFPGIEELEKTVLGVEVPEKTTPQLEPQVVTEAVVSKPPSNNKRVRYDVIVLTMISFFVLAVAVFVVYSSTKNILQVATLISEKTTERGPVVSGKKAGATLPDEMASRKWKIRAGNIPVLSGGETGGEKRSEEL